MIPFWFRRRLMPLLPCPCSLWHGIIDSGIVKEKNGSCTDRLLLRKCNQCRHPIIHPPYPFDLPFPIAAKSAYG
jgi:hypothetical protein